METTFQDPVPEKAADEQEADSGPDTGEFELCGTYGCKQLKKKGSIFCAMCYQDYLEDPEAYK